MALIILQPSDIEVIHQSDGSVKLCCSPADTSLTIEGLILPPDVQKPQENWVDFVFQASRTIDETTVQVAVKAFLKYLVEHGPFVAYTLEEGFPPGFLYTAADTWLFVRKKEDSP
jgi:hypothetical protein